MKPRPRKVMLPRQEAGRTLVMGDLHGELSMLEVALDGIAFDPDRDRLVSVGDLIDRGPRSAEALRLLRQPWFYSVLGNHEAMMLAWFGNSDADALARWLDNGGGWFKDHANPELLELTMLASNLPIALEIECRDGSRVGVIHAELPRGRHWSSAFRAQLENHDIARPNERRLAAAMLWGRSRFRQWRIGEIARDGAAMERDPGVPGINLMICGHNIVRGPRMPALFGNVLNLDTGAYEPDGVLTLYDIDNGGFLQISKRRGSDQFLCRKLPPIPHDRPRI